jgi:hypothetical protein
MLGIPNVSDHPAPARSVSGRHPAAVAPPDTSPDAHVVWDVPEPLLAEEADLDVHVDLAWDADASEHPAVLSRFPHPGLQSLAITDTNLGLGGGAQGSSWTLLPGCKKPGGGQPLAIETIRRAGMVGSCGNKLARGRIGDLIAIAVSNAAVAGRKIESRTSALVGYHGRLADVELLVRCGRTTRAGRYWPAQ